jgi:predicted enzyme related to lactoylglutathione lyase
MAEKTEYTPGTPSWCDIGTDVDAAKAFYTSLFGWGTSDLGPDAGGYGFFTKNDKLVAGFGPQQNPGPPFWSTYVSVADADAATKQVEAAGGTTVLPPMDVMTAGRMAVFQDPQGAFISIWQPQEHPGAQVVNEPGAMCWNELQTRDVEGSTRFYTDAFGWDASAQGDEQMRYTEFQVDGQSVAGMMEMPPMVPAEVPPHWLVYFAVDDTDATVSKTQGAGGSMLAPPMDIPVGRFSVLADPQGAAFGVIKLSDQAG